MMFKWVKIRSFEVGLLFQRGEFRKVLPAGSHLMWNLRGETIDVVSRREPFLVHAALDLIVRSGQLGTQATVLDLKDHERALVWLDGRFHQILGPGLHVYWNGFRQVFVEVVDIREPQFDHAELKVFMNNAQTHAYLEYHRVERDHVGLLYLDGKFAGELAPEKYAFWRGHSHVVVITVDKRESHLEVSGQEIMTSDKVSLRLNVLVNYKVADPKKFVSGNADGRNALYREVQLLLRAVIGARDLDTLLSEKDAVGQEVSTGLKTRAAELGLEIMSLGIKDIILPGDMKELMNKVTEARKAAEANLIFRREETAAMRSQVNTAKLLADNPVLMRLKELEVLEKIAVSGNLNVFLGEQGLSEKIAKLI